MSQEPLRDHTTGILASHRRGTCVHHTRYLSTTGKVKLGHLLSDQEAPSWSRTRRTPLLTLQMQTASRTTFLVPSGWRAWALRLMSPQGHREPSDCKCHPEGLQRRGSLSLSLPGTQEARCLIMSLRVASASQGPGPELSGPPAACGAARLVHTVEAAAGCPGRPCGAGQLPLGR